MRTNAAKQLREFKVGSHQLVPYEIGFNVESHLH